MQIFRSAEIDIPCIKFVGDLQITDDCLFSKSDMYVKDMKECPFGKRLIFLLRSQDLIWSFICN